MLRLARFRMFFQNTKLLLNLKISSNIANHRKTPPVGGGEYGAGDEWWYCTLTLALSYQGRGEINPYFSERCFDF